tara:strand:+ start:618 stop:839 length:222 start_codon:yes stop_codon:yes gene_type:complete
MKKQVDYIVIRTVHPDYSEVNINRDGFLPVTFVDFVLTIKQFMAEGWVCQGGFVETGMESRTGFYQAMVRYED